MKRKGLVPKYHHYGSIQQIVSGINLQKQPNHRVIKYFHNDKEELELQKPKYSSEVHYAEKERHDQLVRQLDVNSYDYTNQILCEDPGSHLIQVNYKTTGLKNSKPKATQKALKQHVQFDTAQMQNFMQNFQSEEQNRKKSKYETIINRLKSKQQNNDSSKQSDYLQVGGLKPKTEFNIKKILQEMTPQFDSYQRQKQSFLVFSFTVYNKLENSKHIPDAEEKKKRIIPKTIKKLGLLSPSEKEKIQIDKLKDKIQKFEERFKTETNFNVSNLKAEDTKLKTESSIITLEYDSDQRKSFKFNSEGVSNIALQFQQKQMESNLKKQEIEGQYFCPLKIKQLLRTKKKIKNFYESILEFQKINHIDYKVKENNVKQFIGGVKMSLNDQFHGLLTQSEKMEQHLVEDIKEEVIKSRQQKKLY